MAAVGLTRSVRSTVQAMGFVVAWFQRLRAGPCAAAEAAVQTPRTTATATTSAAGIAAVPVQTPAVQTTPAQTPRSRGSQGNE